MEGRAHRARGPGGHQDNGQGRQSHPSSTPPPPRTGCWGSGHFGSILRVAFAPCPEGGGKSSPALPSWPTKRGLEGAILPGRGRAASRENPRRPWLQRPGVSVCVLSEANRAAEVGPEGGPVPGSAVSRGFCWPPPVPLLGHEEGGGGARRAFPAESPGLMS